MNGHSATVVGLAGSGRRRAVIAAAAAIFALLYWRAVRDRPDGHVYISAAGHLRPGVEVYGNAKDAHPYTFLSYHRTRFPPLGRVTDLVLMRTSDGGIVYVARDEIGRSLVRSDDPCLAHPCATPEIATQSIPFPAAGVTRAEYVLPRGRLQPGVGIWKGKASAPLQPFGIFRGYVSMPKDEAGHPATAFVDTYDGRILSMDRKSLDESGDYWINPYDPCSEGGFETYCFGLEMGASLGKRLVPVAKKR